MEKHDRRSCPTSAPARWSRTGCRSRTRTTRERRSWCPVSLGAAVHREPITYPPGARTGDNILLATKAMIPIDGPVREGVGLLGLAPSRFPARCSATAVRPPQEPDELGAAGSRQEPAQRVTIAIYLLAVGAVVRAHRARRLPSDLLLPRSGSWSSPRNRRRRWCSRARSRSSCSSARASGSGRCSPQFCSIYEPYFWRHERLWKLSGTGYLQIFNGTPFKSICGGCSACTSAEELFDDGTSFPEKTLVTIGDHCTWERRPRSSATRWRTAASSPAIPSSGTAAPLGANAWVHYGVTMGERVVVDADSFLMKGEEPVADSRWGGNPAREVPGGEVLVVPPTVVRRLARKNAREARKAARLAAWKARHGRHAKVRNSKPARRCPATRTPTGSAAAYAEEPRSPRLRRSEARAAESGAPETRTIAHRRSRRS